MMAKYKVATPKVTRDRLSKVSMEAIPYGELKLTLPTVVHQFQSLSLWRPFPTGINAAVSWYLVVFYSR